MAIGTITMILANVGLSIFNNWASSRQNKQIAEKREEFERAAREGQRDRMLQLMREGQQLTLELEEQKHKERLSELNDQFDNLIKELAYSAAIEHWPLKTLPIVMKNQALGNLLANQEEKVALHCILTYSNCREFNDYVLPKVESALEAYCNVHWSTLTGSPVLFYSGAWKSNDVPTGTQVDSMRAALSNLPTLLITPFFRPQDHKLVFQAYVWGVRYNNSDQFAIPVIEPTEFQRDYTDELKWLAEDGLIEEAVEDLVPYLQCLIGYMADTYFWSAFGSVPQLPRMLTDGSINTDGMKYLVDDTREYYGNLLLESQEKVKKQPFAENYIHNLIVGSSYVWDEETINKSNVGIVLNSVYNLTSIQYKNIEELIKTESLKTMDMNVLNIIVDILRRFGFAKEAEQIEIRKSEILEPTESKECEEEKESNYSQECHVLESTDVNYLEELANSDDAYALFRLGEIYEYSIVGEYDLDRAKAYYKKSLEGNCCLSIIKNEIERYKKDKYYNREQIEEQIEELQLLFENNNCQSILYSVELSHLGIYNLLEKNELLATLDIVEDSNHPYAYYLGANIIIDCYGDKYPSKIIELLEKSANLGYVSAQLLLADIYKEGAFVSKSSEKCIKYNKLAAAQGSAEAFTNLGVCILEGFGMKKSKEKAIEMFEMAAELGDKDAQSFLNH